MTNPTYRRVRTDFWTHPRTSMLSAIAQNVFLKLATGGHPSCFHQVSVRRLGRPVLSEEETRSALNELCSARHVMVEPDAEQVWLVMGLDEQGFSGPKNNVSCQRHLEGFERTRLTTLFGILYPEAAPDPWRGDKQPSGWDPEYPIQIPYPDTPFRDHRVGGSDTVFQGSSARFSDRDPAIATAIAIANTPPPRARAKGGPGDSGLVADLSLIGRTAAGAKAEKLGRLVETDQLHAIRSAYGAKHVEAVAAFTAREVVEGREKGGTWGVLFGREGKVFEVMRAKYLEHRDAEAQGPQSSAERMQEILAAGGGHATG